MVNKDITREANELVVQLGVWMTQPDIMAAAVAPEALTWMTSARDILLAVAAQDPDHPMHDTYKHLCDVGFRS